MSPPRPPPADATTAVRLLRAAVELLGSEEALARRLGVPRARLARLITGQAELPAEVMLQTVDVLLEAREASDPLFGAAADVSGADMADQ